MNGMSEWAILGRVALAALLGGIVGVEREISDKPAGLRTQMLVAAGAALLLPLGEVLVVKFADVPYGKSVQSDPLRIVQAIIAGIAFLGAGTIIRREKAEQVEGLTTAASILLTAAIGISAALGQYVLAIGATVLSLVILTGLHPVEHVLLHRFGPHNRNCKSDDPHQNQSSE